jgi:hypothetical protein
MFNFALKGISFIFDWLIEFSKKHKTQLPDSFRVLDLHQLNEYHELHGTFPSKKSLLDIVEEIVRGFVLNSTRLILV